MMCQLKMQLGAALLHLHFDVMFLCVLSVFLVRNIV